MKRSLLCILLIILFVIPVFSGCQQKQEQNIIEIKPYDSAYYDASQFFIQYMEATMYDPTIAALSCYFEDEADRELFLQGTADDPVLSYEIIRFEKLSDNLWVIELHAFDNLHPHGVYFVNFVGITDGKMLVYRNKRNLPAALTEGLVIEDYEPHGPDSLD